MALPTYYEISEKLGIPHCRGIRANGQLCYAKGNHQRGFVADNVVHWNDRYRPERAGIRKFLVLEGRRVAIEGGAKEPWRIHYRSLREMQMLARELGVRFPASAGEADRDRLRAMLVNVRGKDPELVEARAWVK